MTDLRKAAEALHALMPESVWMSVGDDIEETLANVARTARAEAIEAVMVTLRQHWPIILCDHETKTDRGVCGCSLFNAPSVPTVGDALDSWIGHLRNILTAAELRSAERTAFIRSLTPAPSSDAPPARVDLITELRKLANGMASGKYVADPSPYHAELLTALLERVERLERVVTAIRGYYAVIGIATGTRNGSELIDALAALDDGGR